MAATSLIDFDAIDLTKPIASHDEIYAELKQAGTFALLDNVLHYSAENKLVVGSKEIKGDDWWAADHIPGRPLFPGAMMIEAGAQLCTWDFMRRREGEEDVFVGFGGLNKTRFRGVVEPGCTMVFAGNVLRIRSTLFTYAVQGFVDQKLVFETEVIGVVL